jgi:hypothetical protein
VKCTLSAWVIVVRSAVMLTIGLQESVKSCRVSPPA